MIDAPAYVPPSVEECHADVAHWQERVADTNPGGLLYTMAKQALEAAEARLERALTGGGS